MEILGCSVAVFFPIFVITPRINLHHEVPRVFLLATALNTRAIDVLMCQPSGFTSHAMLNLMRLIFLLWVSHPPHHLLNSFYPLTVMIYPYLHHHHPCPLYQKLHPRHQLLHQFLIHVIYASKHHRHLSLLIRKPPNSPPSKLRHRHLWKPPLQPQPHLDIIW